MITILVCEEKPKQIDELNTLRNNSDYKFTSIFDLAEIQKIQDAFSLATGVASIITEVDGTAITEPSNFCFFCYEMARKNEQGLVNCQRPDSTLESPKIEGPRMQRCLNGGLIDGGTSIMLGDKHIANWLIGPILDSESDIEDVLKYTDQIGVERHIAINALGKMTRMSKQQFTDISNFFLLMAQQLSQLAFKNVEQAQEISKRKTAELEVKVLNTMLEEMVLERTAQLEEINAVLEEEIEEHQKDEEEIRKLNVLLEDKIMERTKRLQEINALLEEEISEKIKTENELSEERYFTDAVIESLPGLLYLCDNQGKLIRWNKKNEEITGYSSEELAHMSVYDWFKTDDESFAQAKIEIKKTLGQGIGQVEVNLLRKDGTTIPMYMTVVRLELRGKIYYTGIGVDITLLKRREVENIYLSYHDYLTGLYNRRFCEEEIRRLDIEKNFPISIIVGDVNGLKLINDAFGHDKGDQFLKKAAINIQNACRREDIVARWSGDEFVILLPKTDQKEAEKIVGKIKQHYSGKQINGLNVGMSFGVHTKRKLDEDILKVLKCAEDDMYKYNIIKNKGIRGNTINTIIHTLHEKNPREEQHSKRVSEICQSIGKAMGFSEIKVSQLKVVGLLHDIGKIAIEEGILNKPGRLTDQEREEIKRHPDIGYRILSTSYVTSEFADFVLAHHERWDGLGYPKGLKGEAIPKVARIIAIADTYDAMTSERSYRKALCDEEAFIEIRKNAGIQFDPEITRLFVEKVLAEHGIKT